MKSNIINKRLRPTHTYTQTDTCRQTDTDTDTLGGRGGEGRGLHPAIYCTSEIGTMPTWIS